ncbi:MAG: hypothetical protein F4Z01_01300 [Gammaproteobacteria bacterium]|nr:hypothetical protein [Gammaproteobacteria bacterium]MYF37266.1 hypothetical protein [Gammaproteobacteria bacterium]
MQNLRTHAVVLLAGVVIGVLCVIGVLVLLPDDTARLEGQPRSTSMDTDSLTQRDQTAKNRARSLDRHGSMPTDLDDLVFPKQAFDRKMSIVSWVASLSEDQVSSWLEQSIDPSLNLPSSILQELQSTLLQKLAVTAPDQAFAFTWTRDEQRNIAMASIVLLEWASSDLDAAIAQVKQLSESEAANFLPIILRARDDMSLDRQREIARDLGNESVAFSNYFWKLSRGEIENPKETWYDIVNIANREGVQQTTGFALSRVAAEWVKEEGLEILDEIVSSISLETDYTATLSNILTTLSRDAPEKIFDFALNNLGDQAYDIIQNSGIIFNWASEDPMGVLVKMESLPASGFKQNVFWRVIWQWADDNPRQILERLELVPEPHRVHARRTAIQALTRTSPKEAAKYVIREEDFETRLTLANSLITTWSYQDSDATKEWVLGLPENDPLRAALIRPLASTLISTDPRAAFQLALEQPIEENESNPYLSWGYESTILASIAYQDIDLAIELLPQVRDQGKTYAYGAIGNSLIQKGETQKVIDLASQLSTSEQAKYFQSVSTMWATQDPQGLLNAFDDLPSTEIKSRVAFSVSISNVSRNTYTAEEIARIEKYMDRETRQKLETYREIDFNNPSPEDQKFLRELYSW